MIESHLFQTQALEVGPADQPFWYAAGTFGPFFINTHYLYGSKKQAEDFLNIINRKLHARDEACAVIDHHTLQQYETNDIYRNVIDTLVCEIQEIMDIHDIDYISGGERRDWFFSYITARILSKPHITVYKDKHAALYDHKKTQPISDLQGKNVLAISDLVTKASSYLDMWIPALRMRNGVIRDTFTVVDRCEGGRNALQNQDVTLHSLVDLDDSFFDRALEKGVINQDQHRMILAFTQDPHLYRQRFLEKHPGFIEESLQQDEKTRQRAMLFVQKYKR